MWLYLMEWDLLAQLSPFYKPVYMRGAVCATQKHVVLLFKWMLFKNLLSILCCAVLPVSVKWSREHIAGTELGTPFYLKCWEKLKFLVAADKLDSMCPVCSGYANPLTAQSSNQKLLSLPLWLPGNHPSLISIWFLFFFLFYLYSVKHSVPYPVLSPLRRPGFVPLYETSASIWFGKVKRLGLGNLWP